MDYKDASEFTYNKCKNLDFQIGDRFHEMYSVWICVVNITQSGNVVTLEGHPSRPLDMKIEQNTKEGLFNRLKYDSLESCWVLYSDTLPDKVNSWLKHYKEEMLAAKGKEFKRDLDLSLMLNELS